MPMYYVSKYIDYIEINNEMVLIYNYKVFDLVRAKKELAQKLIECKGAWCSLPNHKNIFKLLEAKLLFVDSSETDYKDVYNNNLNKIKGTLPLSLRFIPSYNCNENCDYCLVKDVRNKYSDHFKNDFFNNLPRLLTLINEISPVAPFTESNVTLIGGEPTLKKNWEISKHFLNYINENYDGNNHTLITNGFGLNNNLLNEFKKMRGKEIYISFNLSYELYRNSEPRQRNNLYVLQKLCKDILSNELNVVIDIKFSSDRIDTKNNMVLEGLINLSKNSNVNLHCSPIVSTNEYNPLISNKCDKFDLVMIKNRGLLENYIKLHAVFKEKLVWPVIDEKSIYRCSVANLSSLCLYPNGKVTTCGRLYAVDPNMVPIIGDLEKGEWYVDTMKDMIYTLNDDEECYECRDAFLCGGKCYFARNKKCNNEKVGTDLLKKIYKL